MKNTLKLFLILSLVFALGANTAKAREEEPGDDRGSDRSTLEDSSERNLPPPVPGREEEFQKALQAFIESQKAKGFSEAEVKKFINLKAEDRKEKIEKLHDELKEKREENKQKLEDFKEKAKTEKIKSVIEGRKQALERFEKSVDRLEELQDKVQTIIDRVSAKGVDTTNGVKAISEVDAKIITIESKVNEMHAILSKSTSDLTKADKEALLKLQKEVRTLVTDSQKLLQTAIKNLKDAIKVKTSNSSSSNTSTSTTTQ